MHSTIIGEYIINHNGDWSGDIEIIDPEGQMVVIPLNVVRGLVATYVKEKKMERLEMLGDIDVLFPHYKWEV